MISTQDRQVLLHLLRGQPRAGSHAERLENFYAPQASYYDHFRERLLHGRRELIAALQPAPGQWLVELGGGTGRNLDFFGARLGTLARFDLVDLCPSLLAQAPRRFRRALALHRDLRRLARICRPEKRAAPVWWPQAVASIAARCE